MSRPYNVSIVYRYVNATGSPPSSCFHGVPIVTAILLIVTSGYRWSPITHILCCSVQCVFWDGKLSGAIYTFVTMGIVTFLHVISRISVHTSVHVFRMVNCPALHKHHRGLCHTPLLHPDTVHHPYHLYCPVVHAFQLTSVSDVL